MKAPAGRVRTPGKPKPGASEVSADNSASRLFDQRIREITRLVKAAVARNGAANKR